MYFAGENRLGLRFCETFLIHEPLNFHCLCRSCDGSLLYSKTCYWRDNKRTESFVMEIIRLASFSLLIIYSLRPLLAPFPPPTPTSTAPLPLPLNTRWLFLLLCSHWLKWMLAIFIGIYWQSKNILSKLSNRWGFVNCCRCVFIAIARTVPQKLSQAVLEEGDFDVKSLKGNKRWKV